MSKTLDEYIAEYPTTLLSDLETTKKFILTNQLGYTKIDNKDGKSVRAKQTVKRFLPSDWVDVKDIVLGIRENEQLISTLNSCKKQKLSLGFIYIESIQYISVILKSSNKYPLIVIRIPIEDPFVVIDSKIVGLLFRFPIEQIINKDNESKTKQKQYRLYLVNNIDGYTLYYQYVDNNNIITRMIKNISENKIEILDKILQPSMINYYSSFHLEKITDFAYSINNQQINILKKLPFNETPFVFDSLDSKQVCYFKFENDKLNIITKSLNKKDVVTLLEKNETDYWPQISYDNNCYVLHDYDVVFKLNHYVQKTTKDGIYYLMTTFLNSFMFIKVITDQNIVINESVKLYTYQELFNKGTQILEMYLLIQDDDIENEE